PWNCHTCVHTNHWRQCEQICAKCSQCIAYDFMMRGVLKGQCRLFYNVTNDNVMMNPQAKSARKIRIRCNGDLQINVAYQDDGELYNLTSNILRDIRNDDDRASLVKYVKIEVPIDTTSINKYYNQPKLPSINKNKDKIADGCNDFFNLSLDLQEKLKIIGLKPSSVAKFCLYNWNRNDYIFQIHDGLKTYNSTDGQNTNWPPANNRNSYALSFVRRSNTCPTNIIKGSSKKSIDEAFECLSYHQLVKPNSIELQFIYRLEQKLRLHAKVCLDDLDHIRLSRDLHIEGRRNINNQFTGRLTTDIQFVFHRRKFLVFNENLLDKDLLSFPVIDRLIRNSFDPQGVFEHLEQSQQRADITSLTYDIDVDTNSHKYKKRQRPQSSQIMNNWQTPFFHLQLQKLQTILGGSCVCLVQYELSKFNRNKRIIRKLHSNMNYQQCEEIGRLFKFQNNINRKNTKYFLVKRSLHHSKTLPHLTTENKHKINAARSSINHRSFRDCSCKKNIICQPFHQKNNFYMAEDVDDTHDYPDEDEEKSEIFPIDNKHVQSEDELTLPWDYHQHLVTQKHKWNSFQTPDQHYSPDEYWNNFIHEYIPSPKKTHRRISRSVSSLLSTSYHPITIHAYINSFKEWTNKHFRARRLSVYSSVIDQIEPDSLLPLKHLKYAVLSNNDLQELPDELFIPVRKTLIWMDFSHNKLTRLPRSLNLLKQLQILILTDNALRSIDSQPFLKLNHMRLLDIRDNPIQCQDCKADWLKLMHLGAYARLNVARTINLKKINKIHRQSNRDDCESGCQRDGNQEQIHRENIYNQHRQQKQKTTIDLTRIPSMPSFRIIGGCINDARTSVNDSNNQYMSVLSKLCMNCRSNLCDLNSQCVQEDTSHRLDGQNQFHCLCKQPYRMIPNTQRCQRPDQSETTIENLACGHQCNHGKCVLTLGGVCQCDPGYFGLKCDKKASTCADLPCQRGYCVVQHSKVACMCPSGYTGTLCEQRMTLFHKSNASSSTVYCIIERCLTVWCDNNLNRMKKCESKSLEQSLNNDCKSLLDPCINKKCIQGYLVYNQQPMSITENQYECVCRSGWTGKSCDRTAWDVLNDEDFDDEDEDEEYISQRDYNLMFAQQQRLFTTPDRFLMTPPQQFQGYDFQQQLQKPIVASQTALQSPTIIHVADLPSGTNSDVFIKLLSKLLNAKIVELDGIKQPKQKIYKNGKGSSELFFTIKVIEDFQHLSVT
ncbi:unnamed protein product, partial [Didymodactylos carnosus]